MRSARQGRSWGYWGNAGGLLPPVHPAGAVPLYLFGYDQREPLELPHGRFEDGAQRLPLEQVHLARAHAFYFDQTVQRAATRRPRGFVQFQPRSASASITAGALPIQR